MSDIIEEVWVKIPGFWNYSISSYGRVLDNRIDEVVTAKADSTGYPKVLLWHGSHPYSTYVYLLVARTFLPGYTPKMKTRHRDGDKLNNRVSNLVQVSVEPPEDVPNTPPPANGTLGPRMVLVEETQEIYPSVKALAKKLGVPVSSVYDAVRRKKKQCKGLTLSYVVDEY